MKNDRVEQEFQLKKCMVIISSQFLVHFGEH